MLKGSVTLILFLTLLLKLFMPPYSHMFSCYKIITLLMTDRTMVIMCCRACMLEPWRHRTRRTLSRATSPYSCPAPVSRAPPPPPHAPRADPRSALRLRRSSVVRAAETPGPGGAEDGVLVGELGAEWDCGRPAPGRDCPAPAPGSSTENCLLIWRRG